MQKRDFETYQKRFRDFEILAKFSETHVFWGTIHHPSETARQATTWISQFVWTSILISLAFYAGTTLYYDF